MTYFRRFMNSDESGGGGDEMISFGEAFGVNPDGSKWEPEPDEPAADDPPPEGGEGVATDPPSTDPVATPASTETPGEAVERLFGGKYKSVEELEKAHKELTTAWDSRGPATPPPAEQPPEPKAPPLFKGDIGEIKTEADLYQAAANDPEGAAMFAMENHERLSQEQLDTVMNNWLSVQPWKAMQTISAWNTQMMRDEFADRQRVQDEAYINRVRDDGIEAAVKELPMLKDYGDDLSEYIESNPKLSAMVDAAQTPGEVKDALTAIFFMMAGPKLAQQALEAQVAAKVQAASAAEASAAAAANTGKAQTISRNTAPPPGQSEDDYDEKIRQMILNPGRS